MDPAMIKLRFEIWEGPQSCECSAVSESWDNFRDEDMVLREVFYASTHEEAMSHYHRRNGWEPYRPMPGHTDVPFTAEQLAEQKAYLEVRAPGLTGPS